MKRNFLRIFSASILALGLFSCREQPVGIDYSDTKRVDTSYMATVEPAQTKNYYIEEFTGVRCANCPRAAEKLDQLIAANPDRLKVVAVHAYGFSAPNYDKGSKQDLRSKAGAGIIDLIYGGDPAKPNASFDRLNISTGTNPMLSADANWDAQLALAKTQNPGTPINVYVTSVYNTDLDAYDITVKLAYNKDVDEPHALSVFLVEDGIIDQQIEPLIPDFKYKHVLRQAITPVNGSMVLDSVDVKKAGLVYEITYQLKIDPADENENKQKFWNLDNVHVMALVHKPTGGTDKRVFQAVDAHLR